MPPFPSIPSLQQLSVVAGVFIGLAIVAVLIFLQAIILRWAIIIVEKKDVSILQTLLTQILGMVFSGVFSVVLLLMMAMMGGLKDATALIVVLGFCIQFAIMGVLVSARHDVPLDRGMRIVLLNMLLTFAISFALGFVVYAVSSLFMR